MLKHMGLAVVILLGIASSPQFGGERPAMLLKEEQIIVEYTATAGEATIIVAAESEEQLGRIEAKTPDGASMLNIRAAAHRGAALQGFVVETHESTLDQIRKRFPEGVYDLRALTTDGQPLVGHAVLSHDLRPEPVVTFPIGDDQTVPTDLTITWEPDPGAVEYQVILEQGESDTLSVTLPGDATSFQVPPGVLRPATESHVEVGATAENGNCTLVEVNFTTQ